MLAVATEDASPQRVCADGELPVPRVSRLLDEQGASLRRELQAFLVGRLEEHKVTFLSKLREEYQKMEGDAAGGLGGAVPAEQVASARRISSSLSNAAHHGSAGGTSSASNAHPSSHNDRPERQATNHNDRPELAVDMAPASLETNNVEGGDPSNNHPVSNSIIAPIVGDDGLAVIATAKAATKDAVLTGLGHRETFKDPRDPQALLKSLQRIKGVSKKQGHHSGGPHTRRAGSFTEHFQQLGHRLQSLTNEHEAPSHHPSHLSGSEGKHYKSAALRELAGQNVEKGHTPFQQFVRSSRFELMTGGLILFCAIAMAFQIEYDGFDRGFMMTARFFPEPSEKAWPIFGPISGVLEIFFAVAFTVELAVRMIGWRFIIIFSGWFWLDLILVIFAWLDWFSMVRVPIDPMLLRMARLARVARLVKLLKAMKAFDTLVLLIRSVQASVGALVWSFFLILVLQFCAAIILCQLLKDYMEDEENPPEIREEVFHYFGTFSGTMLTMFEISVGNWIVPCRVLYGKVSRLWGLFFILFRCCGIDAMMKVITAVFIAETSRCVSLDDNVTIQKRAKENDIYVRKLEEIFLELDDSGDGILSWDEFQQIITDDLLKNWLATLNIDTHDLGQLFVLLAEEAPSGRQEKAEKRVDIKKFTQGMTRVKGPATAIDVLKLQGSCDKLETGLETLAGLFRNQALPSFKEKPRAAFEGAPRSKADIDFLVEAVSNMSAKLDQITSENGSATEGLSRSMVVSTLFSTNGSLATRPHDIFSERPEEPDMLRARIRELEHEVRAAWQRSGRAAPVPNVSGQAAAGARHIASEFTPSPSVLKGPRSRGLSDFDSIAPTARSSNGSTGL